MTHRATGTFTPSFEPLSTDDEWLGRMRVLKTFAGGKRSVDRQR